MFEKFSEPARRAIFFSRYEASRAGKQLIGSEHVLLGILRERDPVTTEFWRMFSVEPEVIRAQFPTIEEQISSSAELPISENVKKVLAYSIEEAKAREDSEVEPYHLVLAILRVPDCQAAALLAESGVEYELVAEVARVLSHELKKRAELEERTPIVLRQSHYELLDVIAASMNLPEARQAARQSVMLAVMDAFATSGFAKQEFKSLEGFGSQVRAALANSLSGG